MTNPSRFQQREDVNSPESASLLGRLLASDGLRCWKRGVLDALSFHRGVPFVLKSPLIRQRTAQCFLLNGIIFVGSILLYHHAIAPALDVLLRTEFLDLLAYVNVGPGERDDDANQDDGEVGGEAGRAARGSLGLGVEAADVEGAGDVGVAGDEQDWDPGASSGSDTVTDDSSSPAQPPSMTPPGPLADDEVDVQKERHSEEDEDEGRHNLPQAAARADAPEGPRRNKSARQRERPPASEELRPPGEPPPSGDVGAAAQPQPQQARAAVVDADQEEELLSTSEEANERRPPSRPSASSASAPAPAPLYREPTRQDRRSPSRGASTSSAFASSHEQKQRQFQSPVLNLFSFLYKILWLYPIYCISFVLNTVAYQDIADCCQPETGDRISPQSFQARIVDETFRILLNLIYISCSQVLYYLVPYVGKPFYFVCFCWLASLYCFEYRWVYLGWTSRERLSYFENHWLYFAGFGFPIAAVSYVSPAFIDNGIFALVFPFFILTAAVAKPIQWRRVKRIPIFWLVARVTTVLLSFCERREDAMMKQKRRSSRLKTR